MSDARLGGRPPRPGQASPPRSAPPPGSAPPPEASLHALEMLERTRTEVDRADTKASILLAGVLAAGALGAPALTSRVATGGSAGHVAGWMGLALAIAAVGLLGAVLYPRRHRPGPRGGVAYFGDVVRLDSAGALREALLDPALSPFDAAVDQLWQSSAIVARKYALLRASIGCLAAALVAFGLVALLG